MKFKIKITFLNFCVTVLRKNVLNLKFKIKVTFLNLRMCELKKEWLSRFKNPSFRVVIDHPRRTQSSSNISSIMELSVG